MFLRNSKQKMSINTWLINFILLSNIFSIVLGENITNTNLGGEDDNESEDIFYVVAMSYVYGTIVLIVLKILVFMFDKDCGASNFCQYFDNFLIGIIVIFYVIPILIIFGPIIVIINFTFNVDGFRTNLLRMICLGGKKSRIGSTDKNNENFEQNNV